MDDRRDIHVWQSIDTWTYHQPVWEKKKGPYRNPWEIQSLNRSEEEITGRLVFPHKKWCGRRPRRWLELILFYFIFYSVLFWLSILLYQIFLRFFVYPEHSPMYLDIINKSIGLSVWPRMNEGDGDKNNGIVLEYVEYLKSGNKEMENFLKNYTKLSSTGVSCSFNSPQPPGKSCNFDIGELGACGSPFKEPCFYVKVTRTIDRLPKTYKTMDDLPDKFPKELRKTFESIPEKERDRIWLNCWENEHKKLRKKVKSITYFPSHSSFPAYFFPFTRQKDYQDPLVAVKVETEPDAKVFIKCRAWEKTVDYTNHQDGITEFLFFVT